MRRGISKIERNLFPPNLFIDDPLPQANRSLLPCTLYKNGTGLLRWGGGKSALALLRLNSILKARAKQA